MGWKMAIIAFWRAGGGIGMPLQAMNIGNIESLGVWEIFSLFCLLGVGICK